jgi:hypothetical protein
MKKFAALAAVPLFAGFLFAQEAQQVAQSSQTTTTTTRTESSQSNMMDNQEYNGVLVDANCYTTRTKDTASHEENGASNSTETTKVATTCPATTQTTTFGLLTPEGKYVSFDPAGNTQVMQIVKTDRNWQQSFESHRPVKVRVSHHGDKIEIKEMK